MAEENADEFDEETVYEEDGRTDLVEDDEISASEEGFMKGYEDAEEKEDEVDAEEEKADSE